MIDVKTTGSNGICIHTGLNPLLKIGFVVAGFIHKHQYLKLDEERKELNNLSLINKKKLNIFLKVGSIPYWVQFHGYHLNYIEI